MHLTKYPALAWPIHIDRYGVNNNFECNTSNPNSVIVAKFADDMFTFYELLNGPTAQSSTCKTCSGRASYSQSRSSLPMGCSRPPRLPHVSTRARKRTTPSRLCCLLHLHYRKVPNRYRWEKHQQSRASATSHERRLRLSTYLRTDAHCSGTLSGSQSFSHYFSPHVDAWLSQRPLGKDKVSLYVIFQCAFSGTLERFRPRPPSRPPTPSDR